MKNLLKIAFIATALAFAASCSKEDSETVEYLRATPYNVEGIWQLVEWNGASLADGSFAYIELVRKNRDFTAYDKIETFVTSVRTGEFDIDEENSTIGGIYDYSIYTPWEHSYVISELTHDRMVWTAEDDAAEVRVYMRVQALPEGIAPETGDSEDDDAE